MKGITPEENFLVDLEFRLIKGKTISIEISCQSFKRVLVFTLWVKHYVIESKDIEKPDIISDNKTKLFIKIILIIRFFKIHVFKNQVRIDYPVQF